MAALVFGPFFSFSRVISCCFITVQPFFFSLPFLFSLTKTIGSSHGEKRGNGRKQKRSLVCNQENKKNKKKRGKKGGGKGQKRAKKGEGKG